MKEINIKIVINEENNKIATAKAVKGYNSNNLSHQFELLGIFHNLVEQQKEKIKTLGKWRTDGFS